MLWMVKRVFWGPENAGPGSGTARLSGDLNIREIAVMAPLVALIFWMGLRPSAFTGASEAGAGRLLESIGAPPAGAPPMAAPHAAPDQTQQEGER